jgi:glycosyltransferase involved in cell wall biosynthesis
MPDVIHAHASLPGGYAAAALSRVTGVPLVLTEHSWPATLRLERPVEGRLAREAISGAAVRLAVSEPLAVAYRDLTGLEFEVVPNAVDLDFFDPESAEPADADGVVRFALVGRLVPRAKGVDVALEAAAALRHTGRPWHIDIIGDGVERVALERRAGELGLAPLVTFRGYLTRAEIRQQLVRTDFLLAPSRWETFGVAAIEAMAMGVPVIASNTGGLATTVTPQTGVLVEPGDAVSLATAMREAIEGRLAFDPSVVRASVAVRFGADALLGQVTAVYKRACALRGEDEKV